MSSKAKTIRGILYICSAFFLSSVGFAQSLESPPSTGELFSFCSDDGCSVYPLDLSKFKDEEAVPEVYSPENNFCYHAFSIPQVNPSGVSLTKGLPFFHAFVGKDKKHFFIPITKTPEEHLEAGDILVFFRNIDTESRGDLYQHITKGRWHAAMVGKDDKGLFRLDSPSSMSGRDFKNGAYHILRLKKYPAEIKTEANLKAWQADPIKKAELEAFEKNRQETLKQMNEVTLALKKNGYAYDINRVTEVAKSKTPQDLAALRKDIVENGKSLPLYCSELPATVCVLSGLPLPSAASLAESINRVEDQVITPLLAANPDRKKEDVTAEAVTKIFADMTLMREMGASDDEINHFRENGKLPPSVKQLRDLYLQLFSLPKKLRKMAILTHEKIEVKNKGQIVGPSDLVDQVLDPNSYLSYVGSYVGEKRVGAADFAGANNNISMASNIRSSEYTDLSSTLNGLRSEKLHQQSIYKLVLSPSGTQFATEGGGECSKNYRFSLWCSPRYFF